MLVCSMHDLSGRCDEDFQPNSRFKFSNPSSDLLCVDGGDGDDDDGDLPFDFRVSSAQSSCVAVPVGVLVAAAVRRSIGVCFPKCWEAIDAAISKRNSRTTGQKNTRKKRV